MVNSVYNYYLSVYAGKETTKYDTHKRSELKDIYNTMLKVNRKSPLYKFDKLADAEKYAIDIKESAREFRNVAASFTNSDGGILAFSAKKAASSDEDVLSARYIGDDAGEDDASFDILVKNTAKPQINESSFLNSKSRALKEGSYLFDFSIGKYTYEFAFDVEGSERNLDVQQKLAKLMNRADIGIHAVVIEDGEGKSALRIQSQATGVGNRHGDLFEIKDSEGSESGNVVSALGLDKIVQPAQDAVFMIGSEEKRTVSNIFTIDGKYEIKLRGESPEGTFANVSLKPDLDTIMENVSELVKSYNSMVSLANEHADGSYDSERLLREMKRVVNAHKDGLDSAGFLVQDDGSIKIESSLLIQSEKEGRLEESLEELNRFKEDVVKKSNQISINPMEYVHKKLIAYPNPVKSFTNPYISSIYSGMMFNGYI